MDKTKILFAAGVVLLMVTATNNCTQLSPTHLSENNDQASNSETPLPMPAPSPLPAGGDSSDVGDPGIGGPGLAVKYIGDVGIQNDPDVIFAENFEMGSWPQIRARWSESCNSDDPASFCYHWHDNMQFANDVPPGSKGSRSYFSNGSSDLFKQLKPSDGRPGYERIFVRYYAKIDQQSCQVIHHWPWIGGHDPPTSFPWPRAGSPPASEDPALNTAGRFSTGVEPSSSAWSWDFYTYWPAMAEANQTWGNTFNTFAGNGSATPWPAQRGQWVAIEMMVKLNDFGKDNGEHAFWINGELKSYIGATPGTQIRGEFKAGNFIHNPQGPIYPGMKWRTTRPNLMINYFWLEHFVDGDTDCKAWFDDVVVAKKYIGPLRQ